VGDAGRQLAEGLQVLDPGQLILEGAARRDVAGVDHDAFDGGIGGEVLGRDLHMAPGSGVAVPHIQRQAEQLVFAGRHAVEGAIFQHVNAGAGTNRGKEDAKGCRSAVCGRLIRGYRKLTEMGIHS